MHYIEDNVEKSIQKAIERYFEDSTTTDHNIYGDSFINMCISQIWKRACFYHGIKNDNYTKLEALFEDIKVISGNENLYIEKVKGEYFDTIIHLPNSDWFLLEAHEGFYILPMWRNAHLNHFSYLRTPKAAEIILTFDIYIPQILKRAEKIILQHNEADTTCKIIKVSAESIIKTLISNGSIEFPGEYSVTCSNPHKFEVMIEKSTKWIVCSLDELKSLLLRRYGKTK